MTMHPGSPSTRGPAAAALAMLTVVLGAATTARAAAPPLDGDPPGPPATTQPVRRVGPLAGLPSVPGPHVAKVKALGDNSWLELGAPKPDPKRGPARGRSWSAPMPYAPHLGGAFLFGNGPHGAMFQGDHYGDELYFYDANAHAWICCYPGFDVTRYGEVKIGADGFETIDGRPVPIAPMVHTWTMVGYDIHLHRFLCMPVDNSAYWGMRFKTRKAFLQKNKDRLNRTHASPWTWDADTGSWGRRKTAGAGPGRRYAALFYVPSRKKTWYYHCGTRSVSYYDAAANDWTRVETKGPRPPFGIDFTACLDAKRDRVYFGGGSGGRGPGDSGLDKDRNALWIYDLKADAFVDPAPKGPPPGGSNRYGTQQAMMHYDTANDVVVLFRHIAKARGATGVFVYDPAANTWTTASAKLPPWVGNTRSGFYHPGWNAHVIHSAHDGRTNGKIFVYRYKRRTGKDRK